MFDKFTVVEITRISPPPKNNKSNEEKKNCEEKEHLVKGKTDERILVPA